MFEEFQQFLRFLTSRENHWSKKAVVLGVLFGGAWIIELFTGLISTSLNAQRMELLLKLNEGLKSEAGDKETVYYLTEAKRALLRRGPFPSYSIYDLADDVWSGVKTINFSGIGKALAAICAAFAVTIEFRILARRRRHLARFLAIALELSAYITILYAIGDGGFWVNVISFGISFGILMPAQIYLEDSIPRKSDQEPTR